MQLGYNQNVRYRGQTYHVQTEDGGVKNPVLTTILFKGGSIVTTRRIDYADIIKNETRDAVVKRLMVEQHKALVKELLDGSLDPELG